MKYMSLTLAGMLLLATIAGVAQPAAANPISDALSDEDDDSLLPSVDAVVAGAQGIADRVTSAVDRSDPPAAEDAADEAAQEFNANNETFLGYINTRATADTDHDVVEITFEVGDDTATRYLVADVDGDGNYSSAEMVNSTDRAVDETVTLRGAAAENADAEINHFATEYAADDRNVDDAYLSRLGSRYGSVFGDELVETSFEV